MMRKKLIREIGSFAGCAQHVCQGLDVTPPFREDKMVSIRPHHLDEMTVI